MALDETFVRLRPDEITLRFYHWTDSPAVTFGYAQFIREIRQTLAQHAFTGDYCRRPTGGGVVFHTDDLTFSLIFPSAQKPTDIYAQFHTIIQHTLGAQTQRFSAKTPAAHYAPSFQGHANACFSNPVQNDLLSGSGHKILGGAIRRFGPTILYQGSLQLPRARTEVLYKKALLEAVRYFTGEKLSARAADAPILQQADTLAQTQYATATWREKF